MILVMKYTIVLNNDKMSHKLKSFIEIIHDFSNKMDNNFWIIYYSHKNRSVAESQPLAKVSLNADPQLKCVFVIINTKQYKHYISISLGSLWPLVS